MPLRSSLAPGRRRAARAYAAAQYAGQRRSKPVEDNRRRRADRSTSPATATPTPTRSPSAIGYAELKGRLDPNNDYVPVRLGDCNAQTRWVLDAQRRARAGVPPARDAAGARRDADRTSRSWREDDPIREAGPRDGARGPRPRPGRRRRRRARRASSPSARSRGATSASRGETSTLQEAPTYVRAIVDVLEGELLIGEDRQLAGRVWVHSMDVDAAQRDLRRRRRRGRQPRRRAAAGDRARRRADRPLERRAAPRRGARARPRARDGDRSSRRSTPTSRAG